jgi:hypothetical protein
LHPNLFIIGAPKSGTTSLAAALAHHPAIFVPAVKETRYFDSNIFYDFEEDHPHKSPESYLALYEQAKPGARFAVDASVFNMYSMDSIERILAFSPDAKFILVLRDPLAASKSMFRQRMKTFYTHLREVDEDFYRCFALVGERARGAGLPKGCRNSFLFRYDRLYRYESVVPQLVERLGDRLHIASFEEFIEQPESFYRGIFGFLGIDESFPPNVHLNDSSVVRATPLARMLYGLASWTFPLRRKLGLKRLPTAVKSRLVTTETLSMADDPAKDEAIKAFFQPSYEVLRKVLPHRWPAPDASDS